jgi:hypothetical protein
MRNGADGIAMSRSESNHYQIVIAAREILRARELEANMMRDATRNLPPCRE